VTYRVRIVTGEVNTMIRRTLTTVVITTSVLAVQIQEALAAVAWK
jgi:hypothetical protein